MAKMNALRKRLDDRYTSVRGFLDHYRAYSYNGIFFRKITPQGLLEYSYDKMREDSYCLTKAMLDRDMTGKCIAAIMENRYEHYICMFACFMAGAVYTPLNTACDSTQLAGMINFSDAEILFLSARFYSILPALKEACPKLRIVVCLDENVDDALDYNELLKAGQGYDTSVFLGEFEDERPAMRCFTSGTSAGKPKCVELTCKNLFATVRSLVYEEIDVVPEENNHLYYSPLPTFHLASFCCVIGYVIPLGGTYCTSETPQDCFKDVVKLHPIFFHLVPALANVFLGMLMANVAAMGDSEWFAKYSEECDAGLHPFDERRALCKKYLAPMGGECIIVTLAGAVADTDMVKQLEYFGISCSCDYGLTECSPLVSFDLQIYKHLGAVGRVMPYMEAKIVDGVLYVRGENVMKGYYKNPEATAEILSEDGWLCTGDLADFDEDGYLYIKGRATSIVVLNNGENVDTDELSTLFATSPAIYEIVLLPDRKNNNEVLVALIYPADAEKVAEEVQRINSTLPIHKRVVRFRLVDKPFERNEMMKIKRFLYRDEII